MAKISKTVEVVQTVPMKILREEELKEMDAEIQKDFDGLRNKDGYMLYITRLGGGSIVNGMLHIVPSTIKKIDDKIRQWKMYRARYFPFDFKKAFTEYRASMNKLTMEKAEKV